MNGGGGEEQEEEEDGAANDDNDAFWIGSSKSARPTRPLTTTVYRTHIADLTVHINAYADNAILLASHPVTIGTTLKAKGTLSIWRNAFQLNLLRAFIVKDVDTEVEVWEGYAEFCRQVLSKPWFVSQEEVSLLEMQERKRMGEEKRRVRKERERRERREEKEKEKKLSLIHI